MIDNNSTPQPATKVTWTTQDYNTGEFSQARVHIVPGLYITRDVSYSHPVAKTLCGVEVSVWVGSKIDIRVVKRWNDRQCILCCRIATKKGCYDIDIPRSKPKRPTQSKQPSNKAIEPNMKEESTTMAAPTNTNQVRKVNFAAMAKPIDAGVYEVILDSYKYIEANKTSGTPMYTLILKIADAGNFQNRKLYRNFMTEGNALFYFFDALVKFGADPEELAPEGQSEEDEGIDIEAIIKNLYGAHAYARVSVGEYNGKAKNDVEEILPISM